MRRRSTAPALQPLGWTWPVNGPQLIALALLVLLGLQGPIRAGTLAQFRTVFGDIEVELYDQDKPITVQNFVRYVRSGLYEDLFINRCVPGFVIQGGGFTLKNRGTPEVTIATVPTFGTITNEFNQGRLLSNIQGTLAMAKVAGNTNSASSQWFFNLVDNTFLDAEDTNNLFVVFGQVIRGSEVLDTFNSFVPWDGSSDATNVVVHASGDPSSPFYNLPLLRPSTQENHFILVDISLLQVEVLNHGELGTEIRWNSVSNKLNHVEFTTRVPPTWEPLVSTNGTGQTLSVIDESPDRDQRFYRVRVDD